MKLKYNVQLTVGLLLVFLLSLTNCKPSEKTQRSRALSFYALHPGEFAKNCADAFPVKDSVGDERIDSIRLADNIDLAEWLANLYSELDSLRERFNRDTTHLTRQYTNQINDLVSRVNAVNKQYKPCQPEIIYKSKPVYQENTARIKALGAEIDSFWQDGILIKDKLKQALEQAENAKEKSKNRLWGLIFVSIVAVWSIILHIKRIL